MKSFFNNIVTIAYLAGIVVLIAIGAEMWPFITFAVIGLIVVIFHMAVDLAQEKQRKDKEHERAMSNHPSSGHPTDVAPVEMPQYSTGEFGKI